MKTKDLIKLPEKNGWRFIRHGANHDVYGNGMESVPRHTEVNGSIGKSNHKKAPDEIIRVH